MGKTSRHGGRLSLIWNGVGAIAFLALGSLPGQAAERPHSPLSLSKQPSSSGPLSSWVGAEYGQEQTVIAPNAKQSTSEANTAEDLRLVPAQADDPPELPVLEPYIFLDQPVSVPPIAPSEAPVVLTPATPSISVPPLLPVVAEPTEIAEPVEAAETVEPPEPVELAEPVVAPEPVETVVVPETAETEPVETTATAAVSLPAGPIVSPIVPLEPPFLGDLVEQVEPSTTPLTTTAPESGSTQASSPIEIRPANVSRWPDPIPFGQPLPSN